MPKIIRRVVLPRWFDGTNIPPACRERFLPLTQPELAPLRASGLEMAGVSELVPPYKIGRTNPKYHVVLYTVSGSAVLETETGKYALEPGTLWVSRPGRRHQYWADGPWELLWFHISSDAEWPIAASRMDHPVRRPEFGVLAPLLRTCISEALHPPAGGQGEVIRAFVGLLRAYFDREFHGEGETPDGRSRRLLRQLWTTVDADLGHRWTLAGLARRLHVSPATLHRMTRDAHGCSPLAMVKQLRLSRARELLCHGGFTVQETARAVGYETPFSLSRAFRQHFGVPPSRAGELTGRA
jgi:AraC-like DNA-binding protein